MSAMTHATTHAHAVGRRRSTRRAALALAGLLATLGTAGLARGAAPAPAGPAPAVSAAAASPAPAGLPEPALRAALLASPGVAAADARRAVAGAEAALRRASPHDWVLRAGLQRRSGPGEPVSTDRELAIERAWRWGDKAALDGQLADRQTEFAAWQRRLAWHESASALLAAWFELARDARTVAHQRAQLALAQAQLDAVALRVQAGDAARLEQRQAEGERERTAAALARAEQRWAAGAQALGVAHPGLAPWLPTPETAAQAVAPTGGPAADDDAGLARRIVDLHPALAVARAELDGARLMQQRVAADRIADPTVGVRVAEERSGAERVLGLTLSLPFGPDARQRRLAVAAAQTALLEHQLEAQRARVAAEAARTAAEPGRQAAVLDRLEAAAQAARASTALTARAREAGEAPLSDLLQQRRLAGDAELAAALARNELQEALARRALALQTLLPPP